MADAKVTGIVGSQQNRQSIATSARGGRKSSMKKIGVWVVVAAIFLMPALYWWKKSQTEKVEAAQKQSAQSSTVPAPSTQTPPVNAAREYFGGQVTVPASSEWSPWVKGSSDRCVWIFDVKPEQVQVKIKESDQPLDWNVYQSKKQKGEVGDFGFFRTRSDGTMTKITYEFRPRGMCS